MLRSPGRIASAALYAAAHSAVELAGTLRLAPGRPFGLELGPQSPEDQCEHASEKRLRRGLFVQQALERQAVAQGPHRPRQVARIDRRPEPSTVQSFGQTLGELCQALLADRLEAAREAGVPGRVQRELEVEKEPIAFSPEDLSDARSGRCQTGRAASGALDRLPQFAAASLDSLLVQAQEELFLALEVGIDGSSRKPGLFANRLHTRPVKAAPGKHPRSRIKQLLAGLCSRLTADALPWGHRQWILTVIQ